MIRTVHNMMRILILQSSPILSNSAASGCLMRPPFGVQFLRLYCPIRPAVFSYEILFNLIRELDISPDLIFYPEKPSKDSEIEDLVRLLYNCDERSMEIIKATAKAAVSGQGK